MKLFLLIMMLTCYTSHPFGLILLLMALSLVTALFLSFLLKSSWVSMMIFLVVLGGLLIIFAYISSVSSNEHFTGFSRKWYMTLLLIIPMKSQMGFDCFHKLSLNNNFSVNTYAGAHLAIAYLLLSLIVVMEISGCHKAPLRSNF